jgi:hypothetical protein
MPVHRLRRSASTSSAAAIEAGLALKASSIRSKVRCSSTAIQHDRSRVPRPAGGASGQRMMRDHRSAPSASATASTASALRRNGGPAVMHLEQEPASARRGARATVAPRRPHAQVDRLGQVVARPRPKVTTRAPRACALAPRQDRGLGRYRRCRRGAARLEPVEDRRLLPRDALELSKASRCAAATVVTIATSSRPARQRARSRRGGSCRSRSPRSRRRRASAPASAARPSGCCSWPRRHGCGPARTGRAQHVLGRGLADRSGDAHDPRPVRARAARPSASSAASTSGTISSGASSGHALGHAADQRRRRALRQRLRHEVMPVAHVLQRHEQIARRSVRVSMDTPGRRPVGRRAARPSPRPPRRGPERAHQITPSSAATATLACSTSSKG